MKVKPPRFYRHRIIRPKYRKIKDKSCPPIVAPAPQRIVEGIASVELLVYVIIAKYLDHLPLYRQCSIYKRYGFSVSRQNMVRWVEKAAQWMEPIYNYMEMELIEGDYLQVDETPIEYCDPDYGMKKSRKGYLCGYSRPNENVCYKWRLSRTHEATTAHFADFKGVLQSDAYQPYITFEKGNEFVELAACMGPCPPQVLRRQRPEPSRVRRLPRACWEAVCRRNRNPRKEPFTRSRSRATSEEIRQHARSYLPRIRNFETKVLAQEPSRESLRLLASNLELPLDLPHPWSSRHRQQCYGKRDSPNGDREKELALRRSP